MRKKSFGNNAKILFQKKKTLFCEEILLKLAWSESVSESAIQFFFVFLVFLVCLFFFLLEEVSLVLFTSDSRSFWSLCKPFPRGSAKIKLNGFLHKVCDNFHLSSCESHVKMLYRNVMFDLDLPTRFWMNILISFFIGRYACRELEILINNPVTSQVHWVSWFSFWMTSSIAFFHLLNISVYFICRTAPLVHTN